MQRLETQIAGLILVKPTPFADGRGFFVEAYRRDEYMQVGIAANFVQDNHSRSTKGTIRGLHYQASPGQAKLVRVVRGAILDVVVDLRRSSPTFGKHEAFELDDVGLSELFIPVGFAHGFCTLSDVADVAYKVSAYYDPVAERGVAFDDPDLAIAWPVGAPLVSARDRNNPKLADVLDELPTW